MRDLESAGYVLTIREPDWFEHRYAAAKRELAAQGWRRMQQYADARTAMISEIIANAQPRGERLGIWPGG